MGEYVIDKSVTGRLTMNDLTRHIKTELLRLGADIVGFGDLPKTGVGDTPVMNWFHIVAFVCICPLDMGNIWRFT